MERERGCANTIFDVLYFEVHILLKNQKSCLKKKMYFLVFHNKLDHERVPLFSSAVFTYFEVHYSHHGCRSIYIGYIVSMYSSQMQFLPKNSRCTPYSQQRQRHPALVAGCVRCARTSRKVIRTLAAAGLGQYTRSTSPYASNTRCSVTSSTPTAGPVLYTTRCRVCTLASLVRWYTSAGEEASLGLPPADITPACRFHPLLSWWTVLA